MKTKICSKCKIELPLDTVHFGMSSRTKDGFKCECKECKRKCYKANADKYHKYYQINKEHKAEYNKKYKLENIEKIAEYNKGYYEQNAIRERDRYKKYHKENIEKINITRKKYRIKHKEKLKDKRSISYYSNINKERLRMKNYRENNRESFRLREHNRNAAKRELTSNLTIEQWEEIKKCFDNKCAYCGKENKLEQEHFIPLSGGGEYTINNIIPACKSCNCSKNNKYFFEWYPKYKYYSKHREEKVLKYLRYKDNNQQLALTF